jgi:hypothetical protein
MRGQPGLVGFVGVCLVLGVSPAVAGAEPFAGTRCLSTQPVDVEVCYEEFLQSGNRDPKAWRQFLDKMKDERRIYYNQQLGAFRIHLERPKEVPFK